LADQFEVARQRATALNRGVLGIADSLASIGGHANAAVSGVLNLFGALQSVSEANQAIKAATTDSERATANLEKLGAVVGVISTGIAVLGTIGQAFGQSAAEKAQIEATNRNSEQLERLRQELHNNVQGVGGVQRETLAPRRGRASRSWPPSSTSPRRRPISSALSN
jgi:F0F1-type ATP synthase membrane subunit c/vacuolar-type H+-ATPase subunit K